MSMAAATARTKTIPVAEVTALSLCSAGEAPAKTERPPMTAKASIRAIRVSDR